MKADTIKMIIGGATGGTLAVSIVKVTPVVKGFIVGLAKPVVAFKSATIPFLGCSAVTFYGFWIITLLALTYSSVKEAQNKMSRRRN